MSNLGYAVSGMDHKEMVAMVTRRLDKLAMCKRGVIETDMNTAYAALGNPPSYTKKERESIANGLHKRVAKALTPTMGLFKKYRDAIPLSNYLLNRARAIEKGAYVHPDLAKYHKNREKISQQRAERIATLDGDFQDVKDEFILGIRKIQELPAEFDKLEARIW